MELTLAKPHPDLARYVLTYFLFTDPGTISEDIQRADVGALIFLLQGEGYYEFSGARRVKTTPVFLHGPSSAALSFSAFGPLRFLGISLQPDFWGGIVKVDASQFADTAGDASDALPHPASHLINTLRAIDRVEDMAPHIDDFLRACIRPLSSAQVAAIETIRQWLAESDVPDVEDLYTRFDLSERQVTRIANRHFGSPPKALARKYRALRTATRMMFGDDVDQADLLRAFSDHSHMIREIKRVTGQTPRQLMTASGDLLRLTLHPSMYRELATPG